MKIQLQSLRVLNCGPLRDVCIHFNTAGDSPVTVLAGANGSGKTTALKLIVGMAELLSPLSEIPANRLDLLEPQYAQLDWLVDSHPMSTFYGEAPENVNLPRNYYGRSDRHIRESHGFGLLPQAIQSQISLQETSPIPLHLVGRVAPDKSMPEQMLFTLPSVIFFDHTRFLLPVVGDQIFKEDIQYQWVHFNQIVSNYKGSLDSYLIWLEYWDPDTFDNVIMFLNGLDLDEKTFGVSRRDLKATVTTRDGATHFLTSLSSGEQNILIMLLELRRRLLPYSIVLIDEIENSLHPAFQKKLAELLKRMQKLIPFQLIVTTHSLAIVESFGPTSTRILTEF